MAGADEDREDDAGDEPAKPIEVERPRKPMTLDEMALVVATEASRRRSSHRVIVKAFGAAHEPGEDQLREVEVLEACARFLDSLAPIMPRVRDLLRAEQQKFTRRRR